MESLNFEVENNSWQRVFKWDARNLSEVKDNSIDFILTHPPYADIIKYSDGKFENDISGIHDIDKFVDEIGKIADEFYRVLKPGKFCAILMGDTRRNKMYQPLEFKVMQKFLNSGFLLKEDIIKKQHNEPTPN